MDEWSVVKAVESARGGVIGEVWPRLRSAIEKWLRTQRSRSPLYSFRHLALPASDR